MQSDPHAFAALYEHHRPRLLLVCRRLLPNHPEEVEPIAQEAFLRAWAAIDRFADDRAFWPWLSTIAEHLCIDFLRTTGRDDRIRRKMRHRSIALPAPDEAVEQAEDQRLVQSALGSLNERHRRLVHLHHVEGWSYEEIAAREHVTVESVRGALKRAREHMRAAYTAMVEGWVAVPGLLWLRRAADRVGQWTTRLAGLRPPKLAVGAVVANLLVAVLLGGSLQPTAPARPPGGGGAPSIDSTTSTAAPVRDTDRAGPLAARRGAPASVPPSDSGAGDSIGTAPGEQLTFTHVAAAPNDEAYALGYAGGRRPGRDLFLHSRDGGRTWERRPAIGRLGDGKILLPPAYPADGRIFLSTPLGLSVSNDGGATFLPVSAIAGLAAMSPRFSDGDPVFLTGNAPGWFIDVAQGLARPAGLALPASTWPASFAFGPRYGEDGTVYVGASTFLGRELDAATNPPVVFVCRPGGCAEAARGRGREGAAPEFAVAPHDGTVWAFTREWLWRSRDGSTFEALAWPGRVDVATKLRALVVAGTATYVSPGCDFGRCGGLYRSLDDGDSWDDVAGDLFPQGVSSMAALSDGTLLVTQHAGLGGGLFRSADSGATWQKVA